MRAFTKLQKKHLVAAIGLVGASLFGLAPANADTIDFYLNQPECTGTCTTIPPLISNASAVHVIVSLLSSTSATVEFIAPSGNVPGLAYINVNDGGLVTNVTATVSVPGGTTRSDPGQAEDHFGNMNTWSSANTAPTVTFTLTAHGTFSWTSAANVLMLTTGYASAYGHGFDAVTSGQDGGYISAVPEPSTWLMMLIGFVGIGFAFRHQSRRKVSFA